MSKEDKKLIVKTINGKRYVCSRDIKYGDKFFFQDNPNEITNKGGGDAGDTWCGYENMLYAKSECFKILAELEESESELSGLKEENERLKEALKYSYNDEQVNNAITNTERPLLSRIKELEQQLHCKDDLVTGEEEL